MRVSQALKQSIIVSSVMVIVSSLAGCQLLKPGKAGPSKGGASQTNGGPATPSNSPLIGAWQVSYAVNGDTQSAHLTLTPCAGGFEGTGSDDSNNQNFVIDSGFVSGKSVGFHKRYHVDENPNLPPIVYDGTFEMVANQAYKGPYMHGTYKLDKVDGQSIHGEWDAQKVDCQQVQAGPAGAAPGSTAPPPQQQAPPAPVVDPSKPPDISGKWSSGYEYNFKTFHSRMFLEQDGKKITGHGADQNTNESFTITGFYTFPKVRIIHIYPLLKLGKGKTLPARTLEFRGTVEMVSEPEYQGPRMTGKDIGGGDWMAEEVR